MDLLLCSFEFSSVAADISESSVRKLFKGISQKVRLSLLLVKERIFGINSYNPMRNDKYRLLITAVMKVLKSGSHNFEVVEQVVDETQEEMSIPEEGNEIEELSGLRRPAPKKQNFFSR